MWRQKKKLGELRGVSLDRSWLPLSENPEHHRQNNESFSQEICSWRYRSQATVWKWCQILKQVVESQLVTSFWNRYYQWLSDIDLIYCNTSDNSYNHGFTAGKRIGVWDCHATFGHQVDTSTVRYISSLQTKSRAQWEVQQVLCNFLALEGAFDSN